MSCSSIEGTSNSLPPSCWAKHSYTCIQNLTYTLASALTSFGAEAFTSSYKLSTVAAGFFSGLAVGASALIVNTGFLVGKPTLHYFRNKDSEPFTKLCIGSLKDGRLELTQSFFPNFLSNLASSFVSSLSDANETLTGNETSSNYTTLSADGNLTTAEIDSKDGAILLGSIVTAASVALIANQLIRAFISLKNKRSNNQSETTVCKLPSTQGLSKINLRSDISKSFLGLVPETTYGVASLTNDLRLAFLGLLFTNIGMSGLEIAINTGNKLKLIDDIEKAIEFADLDRRIPNEDRERLIEIGKEREHPDQTVKSLKKLFREVLEIFNKHGIGYPTRPATHKQILPTNV